jgi:hypothetical protein
LDIPQAFPIGKLGEGHTEILIPTGETYDFVVAVVMIDTFSELVCVDKIHQLCKDCFPEIHLQPPLDVMQETGIFGKIISNR